MSPAGTEGNNAVVLARRNGAVATVLMHQPDHLNSFTPELRAQLAAAIHQAAEDRSVRVIVLGGKRAILQRRRKPEKRHGGRRIDSRHSDPRIQTAV